jgi:S-DNA-T family DNA segregation ATPase FtsK/SpoIIIE
MATLAACDDVVIWAIDLQKGMEFGPWAPCIDRLATTPEEASTLLADAVVILQARAAHMAADGRRVWEPSPDMPALVIIIDLCRLRDYAGGSRSVPAMQGGSWPTVPA